MSNSKAMLAVTGGIGFIGNNLVRRLNELGYANILIVDELDRSEKWKNLDGLTFEDYLDKSEFMDLIRSKSDLPISAVFHLGACSSTTETDSGYLMENNYRYTRRLCEWCLERGARFITASSAATYGDGKLGYSDFDSKTASYSPLNMYGMSKHIFDKWAVSHGLYRKIVGLKFFNVYGPHECHKGDMRSVVWKAYQQIREEGRVELFKSYNPDYADGEFVRDFVYVDDAVKVMLYFWQHPDINGLFNCGTGQARSWNDLAKAVFAALELQPNIVYKDMPESLRPKYQYFTQANLTKLRGCGYREEFTSLEDGVAMYVAWLRKVYPGDFPEPAAPSGVKADDAPVPAVPCTGAAEYESACAGESTASFADDPELAVPACPDAEAASERAAESAETVIIEPESAVPVCPDAEAAPERAAENAYPVIFESESAVPVCPDAEAASERSAESAETVVFVPESAVPVCPDAETASERAAESAETVMGEPESVVPVCPIADAEPEGAVTCVQSSGADREAACRRETFDDEVLLKAVLTDITDGVIIRKDGLSLLLLQNLYGIDEAQAARLAEDMENKGYIGSQNESGVREILW